MPPRVDIPFGMLPAGGIDGAMPAGGMVACGGVYGGGG
jgi:hypothetical protein